MQISLTLQEKPRRKFQEGVLQWSTSDSWLMWMVETHSKTFKTPHGHDTKLHDRPTLLNLICVGEGAARCDQTVTMPVAVQFHEQDASFENKANVATGSGSDLPCIMGKDSATDKVILVRRGQEQLIFPGPGEYTSNPGTKIIHCNKPHRDIWSSHATTTAKRRTPIKQKT